MDLGIAGVAAITAIAYVVGLLVKASPLRNKWIPIICAATGLDQTVKQVCTDGTCIEQ